MFWAYFVFLDILLVMKGSCGDTSEVLVKAGSQAVLPCESRHNFLTAAKVLWSKVNGGTVWRMQSSGLEYRGQEWVRRVRCPHAAYLKGDYSLHITDVKEEDGGVYTCSVEHEGRSVQKSVTLRVIKVSIVPSEPIEGTHMSLSCTVSPWPEKARVNWRLNGRSFVPQGPNGRKETFVQNASVPQSVLKVKASQRLRGNWTCVVNSESGEGLATQHLSVRGIIQPDIDNDMVYAAVGSPVTLPCVFSHGLIPSDHVWEKLDVGRPSPSKRPSLSSLPQRSCLSSGSRSLWDKSSCLMEVASDDEGRYACSGIVEGHRLTRNTQLVIAKVERNVPPTAKDPMILTCHLSNPSAVVDYEWVRVNTDANGVQTVTSKQKGKVLRIDRWTEGKSDREWTCRFYGKNGILGNATYHTPMTSALRGHMETGKSSQTAILVVLSLFLLLLLVVLILLCRNHQRKKRIMQYPALETIVHALSVENEKEERNCRS